MPYRPLKQKLTSKPKIIFDYKRLEEHIKKASSVKDFCKKAGTTRQSLYRARKELPLPLFDSIRVICEELDLSLTQFRKLFTNAKT